MHENKDIIQNLIDKARTLMEIDLSIAYQNEVAIKDSGKYKFYLN